MYEKSLFGMLLEWNWRRVLQIKWWNSCWQLVSEVHTLNFDVERLVRWWWNSVVCQALISSHVHSIDFGNVESMASHRRSCMVSIGQNMTESNGRQKPEASTRTDGKRSMKVLNSIYQLSVWRWTVLVTHCERIASSKEWLFITLPCTIGDCFSILSAPFDVWFRRSSGSTT